MRRRDPFILIVIVVYVLAGIIALVTGINDLWVVSAIGIGVHVVYWRRAGRWI